MAPAVGHAGAHSWHTNHRGRQGDFHSFFRVRCPSKMGGLVAGPGLSGCQTTLSEAMNVSTIPVSELNLTPITGPAWPVCRVNWDVMEPHGQHAAGQWAPQSCGDKSASVLSGSTHQFFTALFLYCDAVFPVSWTDYVMQVPTGVCVLEPVGRLALAITCACGQSKCYFRIRNRLVSVTFTCALVTLWR